MIQASTSGFYVFVSHSNSPDELLRPDEAEKLVAELTTAVAEVRRAVADHADQGHVAESVVNEAKTVEADERHLGRDTRNSASGAPQARKPAAKAAARKPRKPRAKTTR